MIMWSKDHWYRYCDLSLFDSKKYSPRHNVNCPTECGKCEDFHHDYYRDKCQCDDSVTIIKHGIEGCMDCGKPLGVFKE